MDEALPEIYEAGDPDNMQCSMFFIVQRVPQQSNTQGTTAIEAVYAIRDPSYDYRLRYTSENYGEIDARRHMTKGLRAALIRMSAARMLFSLNFAPGHPSEVQLTVRAMPQASKRSCMASAYHDGIVHGAAGAVVTILAISCIASLSRTYMSSRKQSA